MTKCLIGNHPNFEDIVIYTTNLMHFLPVLCAEQGWIPIFIFAYGIYRIQADTFLLN